MNESYNDEEFEKEKKWIEVNSQGRIPYLKYDARIRLNRLIATVEKWKEHCKQRSQERNALTRDNAKLKAEADYDITTSLVKSLREQKAKLKTQLEAALKRIEEME